MYRKLLFMNILALKKNNPPVLTSHGKPRKKKFDTFIYQKRLHNKIIKRKKVLKPFFLLSSSI